MKALNLRLDDSLHMAATEHAEQTNSSLNEVITQALQFYLDLERRTHERSWRLGESDGLRSAADWLATHANYVDGEQSVEAITDCARRIGGLAQESRKIADRVPIAELGKRWPAPRTVDAHWRVKINGAAGPPVFISGEPLVGDYVFDRGRYYLIDEVAPERMEVTLRPLEDTVDVKRLRHDHPERFRAISTRVTH